jgi:amino acid adenylation domain-containing protein
VTEAETRQLLIGWNDTKSSYPWDKCIHELLEAQVEKTPDTTAVVFADQRLTYQELNARANQLAHFLQRLGVGPEVPVGIFAKRSLEMVVGLLAVLKAGGAYVPLDPSYPRERLAFMLEDAQVAVVLTLERLARKVPEGKAKVVCVDAERKRIAQEDERSPTNGVVAENLAYVIYTSGSTGEPKAVAMNHRSLVNLISWQAQNCTLSSCSKTLQFASLSFDVSFQEMFSTWCSGGTLILIDESIQRDIAGLMRHLNNDSVERLFVPYVVLEQLALEIDRAGANSTNLRKIITAGEQLRVGERIRNALGKLENCILENQYGPSESHVVTSYPLAGSPSKWPNLPPIGKPIANIQIYILDPHLNPVPIGVAGELHIGGDGLARGYLNRPILTAEKFRPNPFTVETGARLYNTGDLARYLPDGNIEFLGRLDHQVKIRGYRIELGEIETVLAQHPAVRETVVLVREDHHGGKRLVAYVVPNQKLSPTAQEIRSFLKEKLPAYMIPSTFLILESLPLTPNGKVDRRALPDADQTRPEMKHPFVAPRTPTEMSFAKIWADVLKVEKIGIHDNFFDLGGHSLKATELTSRLSTALKLDVPVRLLFLHPTVAELAGAIEKSGKEVEEALQMQVETIDRSTTRSTRSFNKPRESNDVRVERRPLLSLLVAGKIPPVDSAALGYLSDDFLQRAGLNRETAIVDWYDDLPCMTGIMDTHLGRIGIIGLPRFRSQLYDDQADLVKVILDALEISQRIGARVVSLTGLIPSATDYGRAIAEAMGNNGYPKITTGHATTVSTVVLAVERILQEGGKDLSQETVAFVGMGSIGHTSLRLMLRSLPHPKSITICDVYSKFNHLEKIRDDIINELGFKGSFRVIESRGKVPHEIYDASVIVGATNVPDVLDIECLKPGTLIVDDSAPHCFHAENTAKRFEIHEDILFTEGGVLQLPDSVQRTRYLPWRIEQKMNPACLKAISTYHRYQIAGCALSGLLSARFENLRPTLGVVDDRSCESHYQLLRQLGCQAADLHCEGYVLPKESVQRFRKRFGYL